MFLTWQKILLKRYFMRTEQIRVLHLISSLQQGGAERQLIELVKQNENHVNFHL